MSRSENWKLVLELCAAAKDDIIDSTRVVLLNEFGRDEKYSDAGLASNLRELALCVKSFRPSRQSSRIPKSIPNKAALFFPALSGSNLSNLLPVAHAARQLGLLGGLVAGEAVERTNSQALNDFSPVIHQRALRGRIGVGFLPGSLCRANRRLRWMLGWLRQRNGNCARIVRKNYMGFLKLLVEAERARLTCRELLAAWQPNCVLTTSDFYPFEFQFIHQARQMGIPTAILQHGEINDVVIWPTYAQTFLAWGETYRDQLVELGADKNRIQITGMPAADALFLKGSIPSATAPRDGAPVCLELSHTQDRIEECAAFEEYGRWLKSAVHSMPGVRWRIRLHPAEDDSFYRELGVNRLPQVEIMAPSIGLEDALAGADAVCTIRSTAGLQAMMLQKPVVVLTLAALVAQPVAWPSNGGGLSAKDADALRFHLTRLFSDAGFRNSILTAQNRFLNKRFAHPGKAADAVVGFLSRSAFAHGSQVLGAVAKQS